MTSPLPASDNGKFGLLRQYLNTGNQAAALAVLKAMSTDGLVQINLSILLRIFRKAQFQTGELYLAELVERESINTAIAPLTAADIALGAAQMDTAHQYILHALHMPDISANYRYLFDLAGRTKSLPLCEQVLEAFLADKSLGITEKVPLGVHLAQLCRGFGARHLSLRCLRSLKDECLEETQLLALIAEQLQAIGELTMTLETLKTLRQREPDNEVFLGNMLLLLCQLEPDKAHNMLEQIKVDPKTGQYSFLFWRRIAPVYHRLGRFAEAIEACERSMACGGDELAARLQMAISYAASSKFRAARSEVLKLLRLPNVPVNTVSMATKLAAEMGDADLEARCVACQFDPKKFTETALAASLPSCPEWLMLADQAKKLGRPHLERQMLDLGFAHFPYDKDLASQRRDAQARFALLGDGTPPETARSSAKVHRSGGFFARLFGKTT